MEILDYKAGAETGKGPHDWTKMGLSEALPKLFLSYYKSNGSCLKEIPPIVK